MHGAKKTVFAAAINPRGANDVAPFASPVHCLFTDEFGFAVDVYRRRRIGDRVGRPAEGLAFERILGAEMDDLRTELSRRFSQKSRTVDIDSLGLDGILFRFVDLEHGAIDDQRRLRVSHAMLHCAAICNIEIAVIQRQNFM